MTSSGFQIIHKVCVPILRIHSIVIADFYFLLGPPCHVHNHVLKCVGWSQSIVHHPLAHSFVSCGSKKQQHPYIPSRPQLSQTWQTNKQTSAGDIITRGAWDGPAIACSGLPHKLHAPTWVGSKFDLKIPPIPPPHTPCILTT